MTQETVTIKAKIDAPLSGVWMLWTTKAHIKKWNNATPDWHCPKVKIDLSEGGSFRYRMSAKDDSMSFDLEGTFDSIDEPNLITYTLLDGRAVSVKFKSEGRYTVVTQSFQPETQNPTELQRKGWQAILENFKKYAEEQLSDDDDTSKLSAQKNGRQDYEDD